jgi:RNA polymerase sigma factor (sigma-70 family)
MMTTEAMQTAEFNDAELVAESLGGNRDAFRQIVERYQTLISSLAYCATGNVSQSEDLAQETFVSAWKQLAELREPDKLRPWLCSITRFLISKEFRRQGREPVHAAESLEAVDEWVSPEPLTPDQVISDEEKAILWRSLERIPEIYREPLVLFYREHQSIETVARDLELSEDAVKQRLSRGRKLLQEQFLAFVAGALKQTAPDKAFTLGVIAALPLLATTAKAATAGAVAAKGSATAKTATGVGTLGAILTASIIFLFSLLGFFVFLGGCIGYMMSRACEQSSRQLKHVTRFWRTLAVGFLVFVIPGLLVIRLGLAAGSPLGSFGFYHGLTLWLGLIYPLVLAALAIWIWRWWRELPRQETDTKEPERTSKKSFFVWLGLGMIVPAYFFVVFGYAVINQAMNQATWTGQGLSGAEAQKMITEHKDAKFRLEQYKDGSKTLWIYLPENGRHFGFRTPADDSTLALLAENKIVCPTYVEGCDFGQLGAPMRLLPLLSFFIAPLGAVILLRWPGKHKCYRQGTDAQQAQRSAKKAFKAFGSAVALAMIAVAVLLGLNTRWNVHALSGAEVRKFITEHKDAQFEIIQFNNGTRLLHITLPGSNESLSFDAPADESTLSLLAEKGITCRTSGQGRTLVTGVYADPVPWVSLLCIFILTAGAVSLLWWAWKKERRFPTPAESRV